MTKGNLEGIFDWDSVQRREPYQDLIGELGIPYPIFPCGMNKQPLTRHGFKDASAEPALIAAMFKPFPGARIGMPTGKASGIFVVDIDTKNGPEAVEWMMAHDLQNQTKCVRTQSGGYHLWYQMPTLKLRNTASRIVRGVDTRGEGGYVLIPPSDGYYDFNDEAVEELPAWLLEELQRKPEPAPAPVVSSPSPRHVDGGTPYGLEALARECDAIRYAGDGSKHTTLNKAAYSIGGLVASGELEQSLALADLRSALNDIRSACRDFRAAERTLDRSFREGVGRPRDVEHIEAHEEISDEWAPLLQDISRNNLPERNVSALVPKNLQGVDGFLEEFVAYTTRTARRPQPFAALAAGIALVSALAGRKYRTKTDLWTNLYAVSIIDSAGGKDHARRVIKRILAQANLMDYLGGEDIASGTALHTALKIHPAKVFMIDECGDFLRGVLGIKASAHKQQIAQKLKSLYTSSADVMLGTEYADQSEKTGRKREDIHNPIATIYGTSTPAQFWSAVAGASLADGLLGRFLVFIPEENYPDLQDTEVEDIPQSLIERAQQIAHGCRKHDPGNIEAMMLSDTPANPYTVQYSVDAVRVLKKCESQQEVLLKQNEGTYITSLAGRIVENACKLALIQSVSRNPQDPMISEKDMKWGMELSLHCFDAMRQGAERYVSENETQGLRKEILEIIRSADGEMTGRDILRRMGMKISAKERDEVLNTLVEAGYIIAQDRRPEGAGRPTRSYRIA
ncbi:bifunctional DNA primase/polymerase [Gluconobacter sphaericus]|uniref:bifunctional DNA primase/polymerase n=1 Tax=Gluconobacter sphaericus TaxID=574987 RepID=UPI0019234BC0|nr:bifunctional DNA primase/polymerase [Gluconobacter sphaericus]QQX91322.1 bifunctional DNA primase/polymerase [Gluconobacter sphaericus]